MTDPTGVSTSLFPPGYLERRALYRAFMEEHVIPTEGALDREDDAALELIASLQQRARDAGLWAPHMPAEAGGTGDGFLYYACMNEEIGRSLLGAARVRLPGARCRQRRDPAPASARPSRRSAFLEPLVAGRARSFFSMTEPDVAGSDPTLLGPGPWSTATSG